VERDERSQNLSVNTNAGGMKNKLGGASGKGKQIVLTQDSISKKYGKNQNQILPQYND